MTRTPRTVACLFVATFALVATATADNIVINGSFEAPAITSTWEIFPAITGWQLARGPSIEIQRNVSNWKSAAGSQYVELDADIDGPKGARSGEPASSAIYQDLPTTAGGQYVLQFAFSPRPGVKDNRLEVKWNGTILDTLSASGAGRSTTNWQTSTYTVRATGKVTRLQFGDRSASDSLGTFLDDVHVSMIPEPASLAMVLGGLLVSLRKRGR
jgi:hypothetical protein